MHWRWQPFPQAPGSRSESRNSHVMNLLQHIAFISSVGQPVEGQRVDGSSGINDVNIQAPGPGVAVSDRGLRFGGGRGVAVVAERGFGDDSGL